MIIQNTFNPDTKCITADMSFICLISSATIAVCNSPEEARLETSLQYKHYNSTFPSNFLKCTAHAHLFVIAVMFVC